MQLAVLQTFYKRLLENHCKDIYSDFSKRDSQISKDLASNKHLEKKQESRDAFKAELSLLHQELETGFTEQSLDSLFALSNACLHFTPQSALDDVSYASLQQLFYDAGVKAFETICSIMDKNGATWADPAGLPPTIGAQEMLEALERRGGEKKRLFLSHSLEESDSLMQGSLPGYYQSYPPADTGQWVELALIGVAECYRYQCIDKALQRLSEIEDNISSTIAHHSSFPSEKCEELSAYLMLTRELPHILSSQLFKEETVH